MHLPSQLAKHFREVHFGGNWTCACLKEHLAGVTWQQATTQVHGLNTIATLVFHCNYYVSAVLKVLQGGPLTSKDTESFAHPSIQSVQDWQQLLDKTFADAEAFAQAVEQLPESRLWETFCSEEYGTYYRNLQGIIEHTHYHLGQLVLVKKMVQQAEQPA